MKPTFLYTATSYGYSRACMVIFGLVDEH